MAALRGVLGAVVLGGLLTSPAIAQQASADSSRPLPVVEGAVGWAGFADEGVIHHTVVGLGGRVYVSPRVSVGPELQVMIGPGQDRDLVLTGDLVIDVLSSTVSRPHRTTPYLVMGGGLFAHSDRFGTTTEGAFTAGPGLRAWIGDRTFVAMDARIGWELHLRLAGVIGVALK